MAKNLISKKIVCDTNVFINLLQKDEPTILAIDTIGSDSVWSAVGRIGEVKGLALLSGLPSKIAMVMGTFSAFLVEKHVAGVLGSVYCLRLSSSQNYTP